MIHISLFSGIGGFDLAAEWMGWKNYVSCEINPFANKILKYYWPQAYHHEDITTLNYDTINTELTTRFGSDWRNDEIILTGGFPCQPFSMAGKRKGTDDERYLWGEMLRTIQEVKPEYVIAENVLGIVNIDGGLVFEQVCLDLENEGYEVQPFIIPACAKNAPHRRDRCWFIAYRNSRGLERAVKVGRNGINVKRKSKFGNATDTRLQRQEKCEKQTTRVEQCGEERDAADCYGIRLEQCENGTKMGRGQGKMGGKRGELTNATQTNGTIKNTPDTQKPPTDYWRNFPTQSPLCSRNDELSLRLDGITFSKWRNESIKGYGNAIVPVVAYELFLKIEQLQETLNNTKNE